MPDEPLTPNHRHPYRWTLGGLLLIVLIAVGAYLLFYPKTVSDPFTKTQRAAIGIPIYYPNKLPRGYSIDYKSVNIPQKGVIVFTINGPARHNIYMSEEPI